MRLPHDLVEAPLFLFQEPSQLIQALGDRASAELVAEIERLTELGLPPLVSQEALATMIGVNTGLIWSFINRPNKHYRTFEIRKGRGVRNITAPRVAIKVVQKWLSIHIGRSYQAPSHVYGFVSGRSHVDAALNHVGASWAFSADIRAFFETTPQNAVVEALRYIGYNEVSANLVAKLCCFRGFLAQGAPTSPVLSNICFRTLDEAVVKLAQKFQCRVTRYADDIVFSGSGEFNPELRNELEQLMENTPWNLAPEKMSIQPIKGRIKIHGLLISQENVRLTRGYRNQLRAYAHVLVKKGASADGYSKLMGHIEYARFVNRKTNSPTGYSSDVDQALLQQKEKTRKRMAKENNSIFNRLRQLLGV
jgi:hypothetical protein